MPYKTGLWYDIEVSWHKRGGLSMVMGEDAVKVDLIPEIDTSPSELLTSHEPHVYIGVSPNDEMRMTESVDGPLAFSLQNLRFSEASKGILFDTNFVCPDTVTVMSVDIDADIREHGNGHRGR